MQEWEYRLVADVAIDDLNELGREGLELVSTMPWKDYGTQEPTILYFLRRPTG
jgi:hypothetical protein